MTRQEDGWTAAMRRRDYEAAWAIQSEVLRARDPATRDDPSLPYHLRWVWDGRSLAGEDVLVRCYHGLGDTIMFARYLPLLKKAAASVTLEIQPRLAPLFQDFPGVDRLIPFDPAAPTAPSECDIEIMELALALRQPPGIARPPYLHASPALLPKGSIALCWRGGDWDEDRSIPEDLLEPLTRRPCVTMVTAPTRLPVLNPDGCPADMVVTAELLAGAELVVTVDTMIAHLAGALGKPTWLLLKHHPDWRWPLEGDRSDWYPTMRIYRQRAPGDWAELIGRVAEDLASMGSPEASLSESAQ